MKQILRGIKKGVFFLFWPILTVALNLFVWTFGRRIGRIPSVYSKIDNLREKERNTWKMIQSIFENPAIGGTIKAFAEDHGMHLDTYYHDAPTWSLLFARKIGGIGKVEVSLADAEMEKLSISALWWVDTC